jgi:hypothetical protein
MAARSASFSDSSRLFERSGFAAKRVPRRAIVASTAGCAKRHPASQRAPAPSPAASDFE